MLLYAHLHILLLVTGKLRLKDICIRCFGNVDGRHSGRQQAPIAEHVVEQRVKG